MHGFYWVVKTLKAWTPIVVIATIGAGLVAFYLQTTSIIDRNSSVELDSDAKRGSIGASRSVLTPFKSRWQLPDLRFMNRKGREITLEAFRGSYVLLNVWATWCAPCREEMPALDRLQKKLGSPEFHVLPLSIDQAHASVIRDFYDDLGIKFLYVYHDPTGSAFSNLNLPGIPATILIDSNGNGIGYVVGPVEWDSQEVVDEIRDYLVKG